MANAVTSLREGTNFVHLVGKLEENNLEKVTVDKKNVIRGNLIIGTDTDKKFKVNFYVNEFTASGAESKAYKSLNAVVDEYVSRAKALNEGLGENDISVVEIKGGFSVNDFISKKTGEIITELNIRSMFPNRIMGDYEPKAEFEVETYFETIEDEVDENGAPTGRVKIVGYLPIYGGQVIPITMYTATDNNYVNVGDYIKSNYKTGKTGKVRGYLNCTAKTTTYIKEGFGAPSSERTFTTFAFEPIINDGDKEQYAITDVKNFDKASIKAAILYREEQLEQKKNKSNASVSNAGFNSSPTSNSNSFASPVNSSSTTNTDVDEIDF